MTASNAGLETQERIQNCQRVLRLMTGVILGAFVLIILMTTLSTGPAVQATGKLLYYLIVLAALCSLGVWLYRLRMERLLGRHQK
jgi:hypothetical protein